MTAVDPREVQKIVSLLNNLADSAGSAQQDADLSTIEIQSLKDAALKDAVLNDGNLDASTWNALSPEAQHNRYDHLVRVTNAISVLLDDDGPSDRRSVMSRQYLSNWGVVALTLLGMIGTIVALFWIHQNFGAATAALPQPPQEQDVLLMVILMGVLGGFLHLTSSLAMYVGNRHLMRSWVVYYLLMPVEGAALAVVLYLLLRVGVLSPSSGTSTGSLNLVGIYGFSVLVGIFSKQALAMFGNVFNVVFTK